MILKKPSASFQIHRTEKTLYQRQSRFQTDLLTGELVGDKAFLVLPRGVEHPGFQRHAHEAADIDCRGLPTGECADKAMLPAVIIVAEGVSDVPDDAFVQFRYLFHSGFPLSLFLRIATAQGIFPLHMI